MKETEALIERIKHINPFYQHLELAVDESLYQLKPGQSLLVRTAQRWDPYLREQWWPVGLTGHNKLIIERPANIGYEPGQIVSLFGPVGQPYRFRRSLRNVLLMAYDTPPTPMLMMIHWLLSNKVNVTIALLGTARQYDTQHLSPEVEVILADDDLSWADQVLTLGWADQVFVTVARGDEIAHFQEVMAVIRQRRTDIAKNYIFGVFTPPLPCGVGACDACMMKVKGDLRLVCIDGPAFDMTLALPDQP